MTIEFFVSGIPKPGGSKRAVTNRRTGKAILIDDCKQNKTWRKIVADYARAAYRGKPLTGALEIIVAFSLPRPKSHYGTGRNADDLRDDAPEYHTIKPDATKLLRSTEDALTGILWVDDAQIVRQTVGKRYATLSGTGAHIVVREII